jgi:2-oxoglutarate ferredoxin oxidoreductase subunit alpha
MIMGDGMLGQMMEAVEFRDEENVEVYDKPWATTGSGLSRERNIISSIDTRPEVLEAMNNVLQDKYKVIKEKEVKVQIYNCDDADVIITAFGMVSRIIMNVIADAEKEGIKVGLIRPVTLWPFPEKEIRGYVDVPKAFLSVELNSGQMVEDVRLAVNGAKPVHFYGRTGGMAPSQREILDKIIEILK